MNRTDARAEALFRAALALAGGREREALITAECGDDLALEMRVRRLLREHEDSDASPEEGALTPGIEAELARLKPEEEGERIGAYKLREQLGEGGFGTVWVADQEVPVRRRVALKIIKLGMDTKEVIARFEQERQALAMMDHPSIARVLDAGATQYGRPFFVMELVRGIPITDYCDQGNLATAQRLELFVQVCQAVQHAHQKGIIHRDLKPSNILVSLHEGTPVPKVIDFGIAKATEGRLTDATIYTQMHQFVGTPAYMSPEQAEMSGLDIDTRSDIYSLGVLLYELLTGRTPFDAKELMSQGIDAMRRTIREKEPARPSTKLATLQAEELTTTARRRSAESSKLLHQLKGDLDWIVMKCLEKDRTRRYDTANGLAADLKRHLGNEPVLARPASAAYKLRKAFRRNKLAFTAATAIAVALILGVIGTTIGLLRAEKQRRAAEAAQRLAEQRFRSARQFVDDVFAKVAPKFSNLIGASEAREALARTSVTFVESLGDLSATDDKFQADLAELYMRLAESLGDPFDANSLGDYEAALGVANQSLALWKSLSAKSPSNIDRLRRVGGLEMRVANILWELGRYDDAAPCFEKSLATFEAAAKTDPDRARAAASIAIAHWNLACVPERQKRFREALEQHYLPYSGRWLERPLSQPTDIEEAHNCYVAHWLVGNALAQLQQPAEALVSFEKSFAWVKKKVELEPNNARAARDWCELLTSIGTAQLDLGQIETGAQNVAEAVDRAEKLLARDPTNGSSLLEVIDSRLAQAKGFATQEALPGNTPAHQAELWQRAIETLGHCQERIHSPELQRRKGSLAERSQKIAQAMSEAQAAIAKIATEPRPTSAAPVNDKPEIKQP